LVNKSYNFATIILSINFRMLRNFKSVFGVGNVSGRGFARRPAE